MLATPSSSAAGLTSTASSLLMSRYTRPASHSSLCSTHKAVISRRQALGFGKIRTTRVRRLSSWLKRSRPFVLRTRLRCDSGNANHARLSSSTVSSQSAPL